MADPQRSMPDLHVEAVVLDIIDAMVGVDDVENVEVTKGGKLQDNPVKAGIYACVNIGDPDDAAAWEDGNVAVSEQPSLANWAMSLPGFQIGGGENWWRRGTVQWAYFGIKDKFSQDESRRIASNIASRIQRAIKYSARIPELTDDIMNETALVPMVITSRFEESGGPKAHIWRGKIRYQVLTGIMPQ